MLAPQGFVFDRETEYVNGTCALQAASVAVGDDSGAYIGTTEKTWPHLFAIVPGRRFMCPDCGHSTLSLSWIVGSHLNDKHRWTREQIADWVETVETKHEREHAAKTIDQLEAVLVAKA